MRAPHLLLRRDPARGMARFWRLSLAPTLFGEVALIREWGRIGAGGQHREMRFADPAAARRAAARCLRAKRRRGYRPARCAP